VIISIGVDIIEVGRVRETIERTRGLLNASSLTPSGLTVNRVAPRLLNIMPRVSRQKKPP